MTDKLAKMVNQIFRPPEISIMRLLYKTQAPFTVYEIAKEIGVSYVTAKKYVSALAKDDIIVVYDSKEKTISYKFSPKLRKEIEELPTES